MESTKPEDKQILETPEEEALNLEQKQSAEKQIQEDLDQNF